MAWDPAYLYKITGGWDSDRTRSTTMTLRVLWNGPGGEAILPHDAMLAPGVPLLYDFLSVNGRFDAFQFCIHKDAERVYAEDLFGLWNVILQYRTLNFDLKRRKMHPLDRPALIQSTHKQITTIVERDPAGNPITNSAKQMFIPATEREDARKILRVTRNFPFGAYDGGYSWINRINNAPFLGAPAKTLKVNAFDESNQIEQVEVVGGTKDLEFWQRSVELEFNPEKWRTTKLDVGYVDKFGTPLTNPSGGPTSVPLKLDGTGRVLNPQTLAEVWEVFEVYETADFDGMGLLN